MSDWVYGRSHPDRSRRVEVQPDERDFLLREAVARRSHAFKRADEVRQALRVQPDFREVAHLRGAERNLSYPVIL